LELAAFHYDVDLPPDVLVGVGSNSEVETKLDYSLVVPLDLRRHDSGLLERGLRRVLNDRALISSTLGNVSVLASRITSTDVVDLSPAPNATHLPGPPPASDPVAVIVMTLLLVAGGVGAFFFLLYRVCMPVYRSSRVAPSSRYEWVDPNTKAIKAPAGEDDPDGQKAGTERDMRSVSFGPKRTP
jgi:hypothetical protein